MSEEDSELSDLNQYIVRCSDGSLLVIDAFECIIQDGILVFLEDTEDDTVKMVGAFSSGSWLSVIDKDNYVNGLSVDKLA